jgi:hypothetical protein
MACELLLRRCRLLVWRRTMGLVVGTRRVCAGECVVSPCLDLSCLSLFLVLVLVVPMHEISACHEFKAAEDHDVRSTLWQATVPGDEGSRHVGGGEDSQGMLVFGNED